MAGRRPLLGGLALTGVATAAALAVYLHVRFGGRVSAVRQTVSDYVAAPGGAAVFAIMCLALAVGSLGLVAAAIGRAPGGPPYGPPFSLAVTLMLTAWCLGLTVAAFFPTDPMGARMSLDGETHRWSIVLAFVSLPAAGRLIARRPPPDGHGRAHRRIGALSAASFAALGVLMLTYAPVVFPELAGGPVIIGLSERLVLAVDLALLVSMTIPLLRRTRPARPTPTSHNYGEASSALYAENASP